MAFERQHYAVAPASLDNKSSYETPDERHPVSGDDPKANLVSSEVAGTNLHVPTLDIDHHAWIEPSSTPGHGHLYIDVAMTWRQYKRLLRALVRAGVVEPGYRKAALRRKATFVRLPGVGKP